MHLLSRLENEQKFCAIYVDYFFSVPLNPWDAFNPGRLDQNLYNFYMRDIEKGILTKWHLLIFNSDTIVKELILQGKSIEDARQAGASGCVEAGVFGKECYILTGYFNLPKILELTLNNGTDPVTGKEIGLRLFDPDIFNHAQCFKAFDKLFDAFKAQLKYFIDIKI